GAGPAVFHVKHPTGDGTATMYEPTKHYTVEQRIRNSRFIAGAEPLSEAEAVKPRVEELRRAHPGCAHVVHAFSLGAEAERSFGMSDDGEPHGTAGRPALEVLRHSEITNCLITVVRYFGGIKLGTGGLVRAYGGAAKEVLAGVPRRRLVAMEPFLLRVSYEAYETVRGVLVGAGARIDTEDFAETVSLSGYLPAHRWAGCAAELQERTAGAVTLS
ncbi:MAG: IMPACT family protein, partial [Spirochaetaceae bacterium]